ACCRVFFRIKRIYEYPEQARFWLTIQDWDAELAQGGVQKMKIEDKEYMEIPLDDKPAGHASSISQFLIVNHLNEFLDVPYGTPLGEVLKKNGILVGDTEKVRRLRI